jgi:hypothetical protein
MEPTFNYIFKVRKKPEGPEEIVEVYAPSFVKAVMMMSTAWPGVHVIKHMGIAPAKGGTA